MKRLHLLSGLTTGLLLLNFACKPPQELTTIETTSDDASAKKAKAFIRRDGANLVQNGQPVKLNGVAFGNWVWSSNGTPPTAHHDERDYARLAESGLNVIRFYMTYKTFEDDAAPYVYKQTGWDWIDKNVKWAKKHGITLILNVHIPQGGFQSQGGGDGLWTGVEYQNRLTAMWREIARRYRNEPVIAGFDLLNEPAPNQTIDQWKNLAQRITTAIREVDTNHLVVVERANAVAGRNNDVTGSQNLFLLNDANILYEFHTYDPFVYTHQGLNFGNGANPVGERYPDETKVNIPDDATFITATFDNPGAPNGSSPWTFYGGTKFKADDPRYKIGQLVCQSSALGAGTAVFDEVAIREYDPAGVLVRTVLTQDMSTKDGWYFYSNTNTGSSAITPNGYAGSALTVSGTTDDSNSGFYSGRFRIRQGYSYQVSGWIKTNNLPATASAKFRIDLLDSKLPVLPRTKEFLRETLRPFANWGKANNVPIFLGEYGAGKPCFDDNRGGLQYVTDMIDLNREFGFNTTYHVYHNSNPALDFAWYYGINESTLPDPANANTALIALFRQKFGR